MGEDNDIELIEWLKKYRHILNITGLNKAAKVPPKTVDYLLMDKNKGGRVIRDIHLKKLTDFLNDITKQNIKL